MQTVFGALVMMVMVTAIMLFIYHFVFNKNLPKF